MYASCWWYHLFALGLPGCLCHLVMTEGESQLWHVAENLRTHFCECLYQNLSGLSWLADLRCVKCKIDLCMEMLLELGLCLFLLWIRRTTVSQKRPRAVCSIPCLSSSPHLAVMSQEGQSLCLSHQCALRSSHQRGELHVWWGRGQSALSAFPPCHQGSWHLGSGRVGHIQLPGKLTQGPSVPHRSADMTAKNRAFLSTSGILRS